MRLLVWGVRGLIFLAMLGFALSNIEPTRLRFFGIPEFEWRAPLVLWLLMFFAAGVFLGVVAMVPTVLGQRRELARLRRASTVQPPADERLLSPPALMVSRESGLRGL